MTARLGLLLLPGSSLNVVFYIRTAQALHDTLIIGAYLTFYYFLFILFSSLSFPYLSLLPSGRWYFCGQKNCAAPFWINDHQVWRKS